MSAPLFERYGNVRPASTSVGSVLRLERSVKTAGMVIDNPLKQRLRRIVLNVIIAFLTLAALALIAERIV